MKEPDYAKLRANIFEPLAKDKNDLSAAIRWPAEKVPTALHDMINRLPDGYLFNPYMKHMFESMIEENTALDEPTAPPIQVIGTKNGAVTPPWEFYYTNRIFHGQGVPRSDRQLLEGCDCIGPCDPKSKTCACVARQMTWVGDDKSVKGFLYKKGRLTAPGCPIFECNDACECSEECMNRVCEIVCLGNLLILVYTSIGYSTWPQTLHLYNAHEGERLGFVLRTVFGYAFLTHFGQVSSLMKKSLGGHTLGYMLVK